MSYMVKVSPTEPQDFSNSNLIPRNFFWTLRPLERWMCLIGVPLPPYNCFGCRSCLIFRVIWFLFVFVTQTWSVIHSVLYIQNILVDYGYEKTTIASSWNLMIDFINSTVYIISAHSVLFWLTRKKSWNQLVEPFVLLEKNLKANYIYPKCRRFTICFIVYIVAMDLFYGVNFLIDLIGFNENSVTRKFLDMTWVITLVIPVTTLALYCTLAYLVSLQLGSIRTSIEQFLSIRQDPFNVRLQELQLQIRLTTLEKQHLLVCKAVMQLNRQFGAFLVMEVIFVFVGVINCSMNLLLDIISNESYLSAMENGARIIDLLIHLFLLTSVTEKISNEIDDIHEKLKDLSHVQRFLRGELWFFSEQLLHMKPHITALGYFEINRRLFPVLVGTTLTYFLILLQFHLDEKK